MNIIELIIVGVFLFWVVIFAGWVFISRSSYKHPAVIAVQTGPEVNDVVLLKDRARVRETEDGYYILTFKTLKNDRMPSPPFKFWQKFIRGGAGYTPEVTDADGPASKHSRNKFTEKQIKKLLSRGILLYKTSEGELKPATWTSEGLLTVLDQDNRAFLISEAERRAKVNRTKWDRWVPVVTTLGIVLIMGLIFAFYLVYLNTNMADNISAICGGAAKAGSLTDAISQVVPGG